MTNSIYNIAKPENETVLGYLPGSKEKSDLKNKIRELKSKTLDIPLIINGEEIRTGNIVECIIPHNKSHVLATCHQAGPKEMKMAIDAAERAKKSWADLPWEHRLSIFLKAAEMLTGAWRNTLNAATMLCQSKTAYEADADSACELMDFFRYNSYFARQILEEQPHPSQGSFNRIDHRPLEGFVFAVTPFNFTAIGANLPTSPAMLGNTVIWKPASTAVYSNYFVMKLLQEAGLPDGVINFVPGKGSIIGPHALENPALAGIHFTGSTSTFNTMWKTVVNNLGNYKNYPRIVGETGGKDFIFAHSSANTDQLTAAIIAGGFSYQGQKCSASSRVYIPKSLWKIVETKLNTEMADLTAGDVEDFTNYMGAVIDQNAFDSIKSYIQQAKDADDAEIIIGGQCNDEIGFFIQPTIIKTTNPQFKTMKEEIFGPVVTLYVYPDEDFENTVSLCESTSDYALTGAIFARDRYAIQHIESVLRYAAGNLYINEKTTGAFVGLQPFGGGRASGTNEKVGSKQNISRWLSPRTIKENFNPATDYRLPLMKES